MTTPAMTLSQDDGYAIITMHGKGLFNPSSLAEFNQCLDRVESNEQVKALLVTGEEKNFSQGLDLEYLLKIEPVDFRQFVENTMVMVSRLLTLEVPVVSVITGHAFGLGAMIAMAGDFSVMREDRGFVCLPEVDLGMGFTPAMAALVMNKLSGKLRRDMMLAGHRVSGVEALERGLVDAIADEGSLVSAAKQTVEPALNKKRESFGLIKRDINAAIVTVVEAGPGVRGE